MKITSQIRSAGSTLASHKWGQKTEAERKSLLARVRAAKNNRPRASDTFLTANEILKMQNERSRK
jgi:hypothetical protein